MSPGELCGQAVMGGRTREVAGCMESMPTLLTAIPTEPL